MAITFEGEVREVKARKLVTGDMEYKVTFNTSDPILLELGKIPPDITLKVNVDYDTGQKP